MRPLPFLESLTRAWLVAAIVALLAGAARAETGGELLNLCRNYETAQQSVNSITDQEFANVMGCIGYVKGSVDAFASIVLAGGQRCPALPDALSYEQTIRIVIRYLQENPSRHHMRAGDLVLAALIQAFPCSH